MFAYAFPGGCNRLPHVFAVHIRAIVLVVVCALPVHGLTLVVPCVFCLPYNVFEGSFIVRPCNVRPYCAEFQFLIRNITYKKLLYKLLYI